MLRSDINVISIDLNKDDLKYENYNEQDATFKINLFCALIERAMPLLLAKNPNAMQIFVWREYAIADANSLFCTSTTKNYLLQKMQGLTLKYPSLCIIAGTIAIRKHIDQAVPDYVKKIKKYYAENSLLQKLYSEELTSWESIPTSHKQMTLHLKKLDDAVVQSAPIEVIRNSCFILQGGSVQRHDKSIPYNETKERDDSATNHYHAAPDNVIFRPGTGQHKSTLYHLTHHLTQVVFRIGVEICAEHNTGLLKNELSHSKDNEKPLITFILSDSIRLNLDNVRSNYVVQADSLYRPKMVRTNPSGADFLLTFFQINALISEFELIERQQEECSTELQLERKIAELIENVKSSFPENTSKEIMNIIIQCERKLIGRSENIGTLQAGMQAVINSAAIYIFNHQSVFSFFKGTPGIRELQWFESAMQRLLDESKLSKQSVDEMSIESERLNAKSAFSFCGLSVKSCC